MKTDTLLMMMKVALSALRIAWNALISLFAGSVMKV